MNQRLGLEEEPTPPPQQPAPIVRVCFDDLINFVKKWFPQKAPDVKLQRPILVLNRYSGNSSKWQKVVEWQVAEGGEGRLKDLCLWCDDYTPLEIWLLVGGVDVKGKKIAAPLNIPFTDLRLLSGAQVIVWCKSDGATAINFDALIHGTEMLLG